MTTTTRTVRSNGIRLTVLDVGIVEQSAALAAHAEILGYTRYWISEHHGEGAIPNPTLMVPVVAQATRTIRVGTAGVLLRYHSPFAVAENFHMLNSLFPGRIDAGMARAGDHPLAKALADGRSVDYSFADHARKIMEVQRTLYRPLPNDHLVAAASRDHVAPSSSPPTLWVHSTSTEGAQLAAQIGAHYAFHDHYNPALGPAALRRYVDEFRPSPELGAPSCAVCVAGYCAATDRDARVVFERVFAGQPPQRHSIVGTMSRWRDELGTLAKTYGCQDIIMQTLPGRHPLRRQSDSLARIAEVASTLHSRAIQDPHSIAASLPSPAL